MRPSSFFIVRRGVVLLLEGARRVALVADQRDLDRVELVRAPGAPHRLAPEQRGGVRLAEALEVARRVDPGEAVLVEEQDELEQRAPIGPGRELAALLG